MEIIRDEIRDRAEYHKVQDAKMDATVEGISEKLKSRTMKSSQLEEPGININDSTQPFTEEILDGLKTIETRLSNSLDPYIGKRVGIVRTGKGKAMVVGYVDIVGVKEYNSREEFEADFEQHLVDSDDDEWGFKGKKYGYILANPERITPYEAPKGGIVARELSKKRIMKSMQYADSYESKTQDKLDFETDIETAISKYAKGEYVHTIDGDIAVSTNLGIVYLGGDENNPVVNRVVKIVETGIGKSGKIELRKDLEIQEIWLDAEEDIADGKNFNQNIFVANLKRVMQSFSKGRITITEYSGGNFRPFSSNGRADRERGSKNLRALERDILYRNVYNKDETDSGNQSAIAIKNAIVENTGVDSKKFSTQLEREGYTETVPGKLGFTDERIDDLLHRYAATSPNYAQMYITYMSPKQFLKLTTGKNMRILDRISDWKTGEDNNGEPFDFEKMGEDFNYFNHLFKLEIDEETGEVYGHNGRHRIYQLSQMGYWNIPVLLYEYGTRYNKTEKSTMLLYPQVLNEEKDTFDAMDYVAINDVIPFSTGNREAIVEKFGSGSGAKLFSTQVERPYDDVLGENKQLAKANEKLTEDVGRLIRDVSRILRQIYREISVRRDVLC